MGATTQGDTSGGPHARGGTTLDAWASTRRTSLDNLKVVLIAAIIAMHALLGYASLVEAWTYTELREVTLAPATQVVLFLVASPFGLFLIALLFLVAGLLTPPSFDRKGARRFVRDRLLRLGLPFVLYVLLVQPALVYALEHPLGAAPGTLWEEYLSDEGWLDTGPLWFVGVLLVFSLGYAGWRTLHARRHPTRPHEPRSRVVTVRTLAVVALLVAPASFAVRLVHPYGSESGFTDLNFWEWPACLAVFAVGAAASHEDWATAVPEPVARRARTVTLFAVLAMAVLLTFVASRDAIDSALGGWTWAALGFAAVDAALTVFGSVWLLSVAQRRLGRSFRHGPVLSRSAYGAFLLQTPFLLGFAVLLRPLGLPAEVKALAVAAGAVTCSFALAWVLITKVPGVSRVL